MRRAARARSQLRGVRLRRNHLQINYLFSLHGQLPGRESEIAAEDRLRQLQACAVSEIRVFRAKTDQISEPAVQKDGEIQILGGIQVPGHWG
jgi:hypothetical protein